MSTDRLSQRLTEQEPLRRLVILRAAVDIAASLPVAEPASAASGIDPEFLALTVRWASGQVDHYPGGLAELQAHALDFPATLDAAKAGQILALDSWCVAYVDAPNHNGVRYEPGSSAEVAALTPAELPLLTDHDQVTAAEVGIASRWTVALLDGVECVLAHVSARTPELQVSQLRGMGRRYSVRMGVGSGAVRSSLSGETYPDLMAALSGGQPWPGDPAPDGGVVEYYLAPAPLEELSVVALGAAPQARSLAPSLGLAAPTPRTPPPPEPPTEEAEAMDEEKEKEAALEAKVEELMARMAKLEEERDAALAAEEEAKAQLEAQEDVAYEAAWSEAAARLAVAPTDRAHIDRIRKACGTDFAIQDLSRRQAILPGAPRGHGGTGTPPAKGAPAPGREEHVLAYRKALNSRNPHTIKAYNKVAAERGWKDRIAVD